MKHSWLIPVLIVFSLLSSCTKQKDLLFPEVPFTVPEDLPIATVGAVVNLNLTDTKRIFIPSGDNRGYSYGSTVCLNDSTFLLACVKFKNFGDFNESYIVVRSSNDAGKTWSAETSLQDNIGTVNTGPPCFLKITEKHIMLFFSVKHSSSNIDLFMKESMNGGKSWEDVKKVNKLVGYYILNNDRALYSRGRIILPIAYSKNIFKQADQQVIMSLYSDDLGKTWKESNILKTTFGLTEPSVCTVGNNEMLMVIRTIKGQLYFSRSVDNGASWKGLYRTQIISPESPQALLRVNNSDTLLLVWNFNNANGTDNHEDRDPLTISYSVDKGNTWNRPINLQSDKQFNYFYPSICINNNQLHITYAVRRKWTYEPSVYYNSLDINKLFR